MVKSTGVPYVNLNIRFVWFYSFAIFFTQFLMAVISGKFPPQNALIIFLTRKNFFSDWENNFLCLGKFSRIRGTEIWCFLGILFV